MDSTTSDHQQTTSGAERAALGYVITISDGTTGAHVRTFHATRDNLRELAMHAADDLTVWADHAHDSPHRFRADDLAATIRAGMGARVWHARADGSCRDVSVSRG